MSLPGCSGRTNWGTQCSWWVRSIHKTTTIQGQYVYTVHVIGAQIKVILTNGQILKAQGQNLWSISFFLLTGAGKQAGPATSPKSCRGDREVGFAKAERTQVVHSGGILLKLTISWHLETSLLLFLSLSHCFLWTGDLCDNRGRSDRGAGVA